MRTYNCTKKKHLWLISGNDMWTDYSKYYAMIDENKYTFKKDGIYSKSRNKKITGYQIGDYKKYFQSKFICTDGKPHSLYIHVALWIHFNGDIPDDMEINHIDGKQSNNHLSNLELLTHKQNMNSGDAQKKKAMGIRNSEKIKRRHKTLKVRSV